MGGLLQTLVSGAGVDLRVLGAEGGPQGVGLRSGGNEGAEVWLRLVGAAAPEEEGGGQRGRQGGVVASRMREVERGGRKQPAGAPPPQMEEAG